MCDPNNVIWMSNMVTHQSVITKIKNTTSDGEKNVRHQVDIIKYVAKQKWKWAGQAARLKDNRWTQRVTEWQPRNGKRSRGRQMQRLRDDIVQWKGTTWGRDARQRERWQDSAEGYILQWMN
ncbi:endonuclease-reverse transcriptase [Elysia marginata]|uniref:Endonuclease-reverse transcriptase n=1 Tax=Elysia marginata TaxID=1093978 RepID=A0AAV4JH18_9GAST|nr:endonuclease-reverse transcriptase [Elysia marginata]